MKVEWGGVEWSGVEWNGEKRTQSRTAAKGWAQTHVHLCVCSPHKTIHIKLAERL